MFEVLQKVYDNINCQHTAMNKFKDLKMIKDFNSFWMEFQVLASELDHNKSTLISELKYKLTPSFSWAMADSISRPKDIHEYVKQCQKAYQDLKDIEIWTPAPNTAGNWFNQKTNINTGTGTNTNMMASSSNCFADSLYSHPFSITLNPVSTRPACSKATRLFKEKIAKLQREDWYFYCKEVGDHQPKCTKKWQLMKAITIALALINVSEMAVL